MDKRLIIPTLAFLALPLAACGEEATSTDAAPSASAPTQAQAQAKITVTDPWVKVVKKGMTAAFGTLANTSGADITVVSAATPASGVVELHEVVDTGGQTKMQPRDGGFVVPAGGSITLKPGGFHIMLMDVKEPIEAGADVPFTLTLGDGTKIEFTALAKEFAGGNEDYEPGGGH
ncbi:copper chaperone PCu(A)C [Actinocorallia sp. API 0066]|uniref:copper chaperone PCu(A)C n=1 Tax=Actinocorallia sp. API 0066 TaxID=2896846 RepID=UPI001E482D76|nr:copper chaperone PCu(A)C [Actinocorallia sp. API 0066]MCD0449212.1 copper chaperone PCu(A)C [Actinocorallia sp. API 0066]